MQVTKYRNIVVALVMMTFIGQAVALVPASCQSQSMSLQSHEQMVGSDLMDHSQHASVGATSTDASVAFECCSDCECSMGECTFEALPTSVHLTFAAQVSSFISLYDQLNKIQSVGSLYIPPISR